MIGAIRTITTLRITIKILIIRKTHMVINGTREANTTTVGMIVTDLNLQLIKMMLTMVVRTNITEIILIEITALTKEATPTAVRTREAIIKDTATIKEQGSTHKTTISQLDSTINHMHLKVIF